MEPDEVRQAIDAVLAGRAHEFSKLVRGFGLSVRAFVHARVYHSEDAEDIAQETFIAAYRSLGDFERGRDFGAWLTGIARHRILEHLRARGRRLGAIERFQNEVLNAIRTETEADGTAPPGERLEALLACIERLPDRLRRVVRANLASEKITRLAQEMRTTAGAIYTLQWRANRLLRECMENEL